MSHHNDAPMEDERFQASSPPHHLEAEQLLLQALLVSNDALYLVPAQFSSEHFFEPVHKRIYDAVRYFFNSGRDANPITLKAQFDGDLALRNAGGAAYLNQLISMGGVASIPDICEVITQYWMKREMLSHFQRCISDIHAGQNLPNAIATDSCSYLGGLMSATIAKQTNTDFDVGERILARLKNNFMPDSTGIPALDAAMEGGLFPGNLYGFAAKQKTGKTALGGTISYNLQQQGRKHLFICLEMSAENILQRLLARKLGYFESSFRSSFGQTARFQQEVAAALLESKRTILFEDRPGITLAELVQVIQTYVVRHKISGFILDYWQLVKGKPKNESDAKHLDNVAQTIADLCKKHSIWGITMAQINRQGEFRESDGLLNSCEQGYIMHRHDGPNPAIWLEMYATRYTKKMDIGDDITPGLLLNEKGPFFEQFTL